MQDENLRDTFRDMTPDEMREASREAEIAEWHESNRFCGRCGAEMKPHDDPSERALVCAKCGYTVYPKISPAVMESGWFDREHPPETPRHGSIARAMLAAWTKGEC